MLIEGYSHDDKNDFGNEAWTEPSVLQPTIVTYDEAAQEAWLSTQYEIEVAVNNIQTCLSSLRQGSIRSRVSNWNLNIV